jgi:chemotaxis response regulator CheB
MRISVVQSQFTNPTKEIQEKKIPQSIRLKNDLTTDTFTREKANNVSFKGDGAAKGGLIGMGLGGLAALAIIAATGGAAAPVVAIYFGSVAAGTATGAAIGAAVDK